MPHVLRPEADASGCRFCLVASRFNEPYVERLVRGALEVLVNRGAADQDLEVRWVPGSFELPLACRWAADSGRFDAILAFGVLLRGETEHFQLVADASSQGLQRVALDTGTPVLNGIVAAHDAEQVAARSGGAHGNRGAEVALAAVSMARLKRGLDAR